ERRHGHREEAAVPVSLRLLELQPLVRAERLERGLRRRAPQQPAHLPDSRQKSFARRVPPRAARPVAVPEVDGKAAVRPVEEDLSARARDAEQLAQKRDAALVAIRHRPYLVAREGLLRDADVLDDAR